MSPLLPPNCSLLGARVQVPLTLSDTCTSPEAPYWANQPTSRSPAPTGWDSVTVVEVTFAVENEVPCTNDPDADARDANTASSMDAITARARSEARAVLNRPERIWRFPAATVNASEDTGPPTGAAAHAPREL
jgi:hypothetical protein